MLCDDQQQSSTSRYHLLRHSPELIAMLTERILNVTGYITVGPIELRSLELGPSIHPECHLMLREQARWTYMQERNDSLSQ
jgi:hypothetical protein